MVSHKKAYLLNSAIKSLRYDRFVSRILADIAEICIVHGNLKQQSHIFEFNLYSLYGAMEQTALQRRQSGAPAYLKRINIRSRYPFGAYSSNESPTSTFAARSRSSSQRKGSLRF